MRFGDRPDSFCRRLLLANTAFNMRIEHRICALRNAGEFLCQRTGIEAQCLMGRFLEPNGKLDPKCCTDATGRPL